MTLDRLLSVVVLSLTLACGEEGDGDDGVAGAENGGTSGSARQRVRLEQVACPSEVPVAPQVEESLEPQRPALPGHPVGAGARRIPGP
jgi:hypothetical protein